MPNTARKLQPVQLILLAIPCVAVLAVPWFNTIKPSLFGMPFFYWWQLIWVPLSSVCIGLAYMMAAPPGGGD